MFKTQSGNGHMVFVRKILRNKFLIYDPQKGKYWLSKKEFKKKWSGILLRVLFYEKKNYKSENLEYYAAALESMGLIKEIEISAEIREKEDAFKQQFNINNCACSTTLT
jgi:ABC-type bacteriocin/lantibiotic exporter with double-glycine peptidase domain